MSSNNQLIIKKRNKHKYDIYMDFCVDNKFKYLKENKLETETSLSKAIKWCHKYMAENLVEYGYFIDLEEEK